LRSWLRHYDTSRWVAGASTDEVDFINWPNPCSCTRAYPNKHHKTKQTGSTLFSSLRYRVWSKSISSLGYVSWSSRTGMTNLTTKLTAVSVHSLQESPLRRGAIVLIGGYSGKQILPLIAISKYLDVRLHAWRIFLSTAISWVSRNFLKAGF
jgi:hypothetical protein